jgi:hypothetical protein
MVYVPKTYNERKIWKVLNQHPNGLGKNKIVEKSGVNSSSTQKILTKFRELNEIEYPKVKRGEKSNIKIKQIKNSHIFTRIKKDSKSIEEAWKKCEGIIVELKGGMTIQAGIDDTPDFKGDTLELYDVYFLEGRNWKPLEEDILIQSFDLLDIEKIWSPDLVKLNFKIIEFSTIRELWIDPSFEVLRSINCEGGWRRKKPHSPKCDGVIHDTMAKLITYGKSAYFDNLRNSVSDENERRKQNKEFDRHIRILMNTMIKNGIKIPGGNEEY